MRFTCRALLCSESCVLYAVDALCIVAILLLRWEAQEADSPAHPGHQAPTAADSAPAVPQSERSIMYLITAPAQLLTGAVVAVPWPSLPPVRPLSLRQQPHLACAAHWWACPGAAAGAAQTGAAL